MSISAADSDSTADSFSGGLQSLLERDTSDRLKMPRSGHGHLPMNALVGQRLSSRRKVSPHSTADDPSESRCRDLTGRQAEVLHWIAEGKSNSEIATILGCSPETVKNHVKQVFQRLGVHSRTAAAAYAYRQIIAEAERLRSAVPTPAEPKAKRRRSSPR